MENYLNCNLETGVCGTDSDNQISIDLNQKEIEVYYFTDPICSHCWALEPTLRKLRLEYGQLFKFHTVMGGLIEKWEGFGDQANGISRPSDVTKHWRKVGQHSRMPIDGSLWKDNPIMSSYPASKVFKVIQSQSYELADKFLRFARYTVFVKNQNISSKEILVDLVNELDLIGEEILKRVYNDRDHSLLSEDFKLKAQFGVRGFPTLVFIDKEGKGIKVVGVRDLQTYIEVLKYIGGSNSIKPRKIANLKGILQEEKILFSKEIEVLYGINRDGVESFVQTELNDKFIKKDILGENHYSLKI